MNERIVVQVEDAIATIVFNRPQVLNALDDQMILAFRAACERVGADEAIRCVVVRGDGPAFLAGGDVAMSSAESCACARTARRHPGVASHAQTGDRERAWRGRRCRCEHHGGM
jgi:2-(1,2-epoxy-1,2-dihydrophenyl)acetyl-CoA isomerase